MGRLEGRGSGETYYTYYIYQVYIHVHACTCLALVAPLLKRIESLPIIAAVIKIHYFDNIAQPASQAGRHYPSGGGEGTLPPKAGGGKDKVAHHKSMPRED